MGLPPGVLRERYIEYTDKGFRQYLIGQVVQALIINEKMRKGLSGMAEQASSGLTGDHKEMQLIAKIAVVVADLVIAET